MSHQFIGLLLLVLAVAAGFYVSSHYLQLTSLQLPVPSALNSVQLPSSAVLNPAPAPVISTASQTVTQKPVTISYVTLASSGQSYTELALVADGGSQQPVDVTGWHIADKSGVSFTIPQAQQLYSFNGPQSDIALKPGDTLRIFSGPANIGNFRMNKCMGYIQDRTSFTPPIPMTCPTTDPSATVDFSSQCQDYIASLNACQNPSANPPVPPSDDKCFAFLQTLNYTGCVAAHQQDTDFYSNEWWVWVDDKMNSFDPTHDKIQLLDTSGTVVDEYTY
ncbi:hypothetical protein KGO95_04095 [Patescibacteria group bacterium]|nr:hypothetical protein [Patescibacteria group bacterium]